MGVVLPNAIAARAPPPSFSTPPVLAIWAKILANRSSENTRRPPVWPLPSCLPEPLGKVRVRVGVEVRVEVGLRVGMRVGVVVGIKVG